MSHRPYIVILEGPDGCGKTSFAKALFDFDPDTVLFRSGPPKGSAMAQYEGKIKHAFECRNVYGMNVVIDRLHVGEMVYGPLLRGGSTLVPGWFEQFEKRLGATNVVRAYVTIDSWDIHRKRLELRDNGKPDELSGVGIDQIVAVRNVYEQLIGSNPAWTKIETSTLLPKVLAKNFVNGWLKRLPTLHETQWMFNSEYQQNPMPDRE